MTFLRNRISALPSLLLAAACTVSTTQQISSAAPFPIDVRDDEPAFVQFHLGTPVRFSRVRLVGDTLYTWGSSASRITPDSQAIPLRRVVSIHQEHLDVAETLSRALFIGALTVAAFVAWASRYLE